MSPEPEETSPAVVDRREAVREKAQQVQEQQKRMRWIRRGGLAAGAVAAVAVIAMVVTWSISSTTNRPELTPNHGSNDGFPVNSVSSVLSAQTEMSTTTPAPTPEEAAGGEAQTVEPVDIHVYVDYLSRGAREWHLANAQQLSVWVKEGAATLTYHPVSMLTAKSNGTKYSLRAAGAAACVATHSPETLFAFNADLLTRQPAIDSDGHSDVELADIAQAIGAENPKVVRSCIENGDFLNWVKDATERAVGGIEGTDGLALTGTPMIVVNGQPYLGALGDPAEFSQFVLTNATGAFYKSQSPTPSPVPTP